MNTHALNTTILFYPNKNPSLRLFALWYFTTLMIIWNVLGHTVLGFEQSWAAPIVAVITGIVVQMLLEWVDAKAKNREVRFVGGISPFLNFLPTALIPALACAMLLYSDERLLPIVFATTLAIASKVLFRAPVGNGHYQHVFNPSNFAIAVTFVLFPQVGVGPPNQFTQDVTGAGDLIVPVVVLVTGFIIHALFTGRLLVCGAWVVGFVIQGLVRATLSGTPLVVPLMPMTGAAFTLFTLYMVPDPATTPIKPLRQFAFGFAVAAVYGILQMLHVVFGLFFALVIVSAIRGASLWLWSSFGKMATQAAEQMVEAKPAVFQPVASQLHSE
jgi:hypothetical protein